MYARLIGERMNHVAIRRCRAFESELILAIRAKNKAATVYTLMRCIDSRADPAPSHSLYAQLAPAEQTEQAMKTTSTARKGLAKPTGRPTKRAKGAS